ncbi:MAG: recombinase, partial [Blautia sp.]|nr:recombinase [Blautia sp.]
MSAKTYRDKHAMPFVMKLKDIVKNLTIKYVNLMEQLQEKADDFERVKQYVGADKIDTIVANARELERI